MRRERLSPTVRFGASLLSVLTITAGACDQRRATRPEAAPSPAPSPEARTLATLPFLHPEAIVARGTDLLSDRYDPTRIGKPLDEIDVLNDYDFARLHAVEQSLVGVDRRAVLREIFDLVTAGAPDDEARHVRVLEFLQRASVHSAYLQPMYGDGSMVMDPLVLLALNEMRCGQVAIVAVDLFESAGYPGRLTALGGHVVAEISFGGSWHLLDADLFGGGHVVRNADGSIPSVATLSTAPERLDAVPSFVEALLAPGGGGIAPIGGQAPYPSWFYFGTGAYAGSPRYLTKKATPEQAASSRYYGWNSTTSVLAEDIKLYDIELRWTPSPVRFLAVETLADGRKRIRWEPVIDDGDLSGYQIFVSKESRGWNYSQFSGEPDAEEHWTGGWSRGMYDALFALPPDDSETFDVSSDTTEIILGPYDTQVHVSVMAVDSYGASVGRELFRLSEELDL